MSPSFTSDDVGKPVETADGERVGVVADVDPETAYVEPASDVGDSTRAALDWGSGEEAVPLADSAVGEWTGDAIRLEAEVAADAVTSGDEPNEEASSDDGAAEIGSQDADYDPGEPVASNPTEAPPDEPGTTPDNEIGNREGTDPMVEDDEFYDSPEDGPRVDPDDQMESPAEIESSQDTAGRVEETTADDRDRDDVDVDPDEVTDGEPEAEIDSEEDVARRGDPGDSSD
ncbi:hypothetical protein [Haloterrigena salifodinae]|uniref:hypothetical protein n=1 Tax=Haloterrigena salifodinae TaxID=2675099 RepID=UPI000F85EEE6|nr:hypothetical protein [Haloterrigena salifodinae]